MTFRDVRLPNGLTVLVESDPAAHSTAAGFAVRAGSRDETEDVSGVSHFLEHMAFKGNERFSAADVNRVFDELGARSNAFTSEEMTFYYAAVLPEHLPRTLELLAALIFPTLRQEDFDVEQKVILEEIAMYDDKPSFLAYDLGMQAHFAGHPLGRSILGSKESVAALTSDAMRRYHASRYKAGNIVLAVCGRAEPDEILALAQRHCGGWPAGDVPRTVTEARPKGATVVRGKSGTQQTSVMQFAPAPCATDDRRFAAEILSVVVGDDGGSRLYWELVDPGHVEAAELGFNDYEGSGTWMTFVGGDPESIAENLDRVRAVYEAVNRDGIDESELRRAKNKVAARLVLRSEKPMGRLVPLAGNWVYRHEYRTLEDDLAAYDRVTRADIRTLLDAYPLAQTTTMAVGPEDTLAWPR